MLRTPNIGVSRIQNIPDHISESLETICWVKNMYLNSLLRIRNLFDPASGMEKFGSVIRVKHPGSATLPETDRIRVLPGT
jgi:hypothetical protein